MKRLRHGLTLLGVVGLTACTSIPSAQEQPSPEPTRIPPAALVPQPEGTPLPPRDPRIAERWPPEIKQLVDNMLTLFPRTPNARPPSVEEIEKKMGITLTERPLTPDESRTYSKQYVVSGTRYRDPMLEQTRSPFGARYNILQKWQTQYLKLVVAPEQSGFCLDPYELAVYTGATFVSAKTASHVVFPPGPPAYAWGMFRSGGPYSALEPSFGISVWPSRDPVTQQVINDGCVGNIAVGGGSISQQKKPKPMTAITTSMLSRSAPPST